MYKTLDEQIRNWIMNATEQWMATKCLVVKELEQRHDNFAHYKNLKELTERVKHIFINKQPRLELDQVCKHW